MQIFNRKKKRRYPKTLVVSQEIHKRLMKEKPKKMILNDYIEFILDHNKTCGLYIFDKKKLYSKIWKKHRESTQK